ncbi:MULTISPECIES: flagellar assembly protein FliW [unclassified Paenibacillus]|uniref:flagellar assembly protein FliW n=1 Tax=unclassified Paenibacillus TaxID=185978 RepID=UPI00088A0A0B|nr:MULTISPECIES: flagellar assembly protein FliW [unclassified Paenibacillus]WKL04035.1 flagellar assembly protein FliW [Paenibacillus amylolyticus]SDK87205.1 flagellar assembly factor FliW [Paenibacillus sp. OK060]
MIKIHTSMWGEVEVQDEEVYQFPKGLPGFDEETEFALIPWEDTPFSYLQSAREPGLAFLLVNPFTFVPDYNFELGEVDKEELEIIEQVSVYSMVTIHSQANKSTMNLLAPLVLNPEQHIGKQIVLHQSSYDTRHLIWAEDDAKSVKGGV